MIDRRALLAAGGAVFAGGGARAVGARTVAAPSVTRLRVAGDRLFVPVTINGIAVEALLDSAAETSIVDTAFAATLRLTGGEAATARGTGAATAAATLVTGVTLDVAGLRLHPREVAVIDLSDIARRLGNGPIRLILGREIFDATALAIDIEGATLAVVPPGPHPGQRLPLIARRGIEQVPVTVEGIAATADFDLGNGGTVLIGAAFAARHGLLDGRDTRSIGGGGIGGATRQINFILRSIEVAGVRLNDLPAAIDASATASDANIGVRLLRRFGIVTDFAARAVWLDDRG